MTSNRCWLIATVGVLPLLVVVSVAADRPLATWSHRQFFGTRIEAIGSFILWPLDGLLAITAILALGAAVWRYRRGRVPAIVASFLRAAASAGAALVVTVAAKVLLGRSQIWPAFLEQHVFALNPLHWNRDYGAFPSATMAGATAFLCGWRPTGCWPGAPAMLVLVILAAALIVTNSHWMSDILGGVCVGALVPIALSRIATAKRGTVAA